MQYKVNLLNIHSTFPEHLSIYIYLFILFFIRLYTARVYTLYDHEYSE